MVAVAVVVAVVVVVVVVVVVFHSVLAAKTSHFQSK